MRCLHFSTLGFQHGSLDLYPELCSWFSHEHHDLPSALHHAVAQFTFLLRAAAFLWPYRILSGECSIIRAKEYADDGRPHLADRTGRLVPRRLRFTFWLASYDWIMSLEPEWTSTVFAYYNFAGLFEAAWRSSFAPGAAFPTTGPVSPRCFRRACTHLGKFALHLGLTETSSRFADYMLISYVNNPEETPSTSTSRSLRLFWANVVLICVHPFLVLPARVGQAQRQGARQCGRCGARRPTGWTCS